MHRCEGERIIMADAKEKKLTEKEVAFISEYLIDFNATQAYIRAGYGNKSARQLAARLLSKDYIQAAIKIEVDKILSNNRTLALKVVRECEKIAFGKISDVMDFDDDGVTLKSSKEIDTSTIESVGFDESYTQSGVNRKKRIKLYSKEKALEILAKYTTLYSDAPHIDLNINTEDENVKTVLAKHGIKTSKD